MGFPPLKLWIGWKSNSESPIKGGSEDGEAEMTVSEPTVDHQEVLTGHETHLFIGVTHHDMASIKVFSHFIRGVGDR
ncbi:hypothetical protein A8709_09635 [Paenibacillus pectinilyticus]|uniref:Uncharacterized protein n=1 Tax=Paenibacillus pectinilyticus TaxID=512399 RepID=A0A1C1A5Q5_9BACL|nr:hypothetical protein A8709_09635 [Paenibacillus pectinilyticus]